MCVPPFPTFASPNPNATPNTDQQTSPRATLHNGYLRLRSHLPTKKTKTRNRGNSHVSLLDRQVVKPRFYTPLVAPPLIPWLLNTIRQRPMPFRNRNLIPALPFPHGCHRSLRYPPSMLRDIALALVPAKTPTWCILCAVQTNTLDDI
jgi:hypothetical protein